MLVRFLPNHPLSPSHLTAFLYRYYNFIPFLSFISRQDLPGGTQIFPFLINHFNDLSHTLSPCYLLPKELPCLRFAL